MYPMPFSADIHSSSKILVEEVVSSLSSHLERLHALQSLASAVRTQLAEVARSYLFSLAPEAGVEVQFAVLRAPGGDGQTYSAVTARTMGIMLSSDDPSEEMESAETESIIEAATAFGLRAPNSRPAIDTWLGTEAAKPLMEFLSALWGCASLTFADCGKLDSAALLVTRQGFKILGKR